MTCPLCYCWQSYSMLVICHSVKSVDTRLAIRGWANRIRHWQTNVKLCSCLRSIIIIETVEDFHNKRMCSCIFENVFEYSYLLSFFKQWCAHIPIRLFALSVTVVMGVVQPCQLICSIFVGNFSKMWWWIFFRMLQQMWAAVNSSIGRILCYVQRQLLDFWVLIFQSSIKLFCPPMIYDMIYERIEEHQHAVNI